MQTPLTSTPPTRRKRTPTLCIVVPCYNEQEALPETARVLSGVREALIAQGAIAEDSKIVFVDDGSFDETWALIAAMAGDNGPVAGIKLAGNRGHQNALLCGLLSVPGDIVVSIDADLQDDTAAICDMVAAYDAGADIVYGVRVNRDTDTAFKRITAQTYYRLLHGMGVKAVFNHADFRLMSRRAIEALRQYGETNLFLRGIIPTLGFKTHAVAYARKARTAGESKYPVSKMAALALDGITSFSIMPLRWITAAGVTISLVSFSIGIWAVLVRFLSGNFVPGWASTVIPLYFLGGIQLLSIGIVGEYLGKAYLEAKRRPRYIIETQIGL